MSKADVARRIGPLLVDLIDAERERQARANAECARGGTSPELSVVGARGENEKSIHA